MLKEADCKIRQALDYWPDFPYALGNKGYILFLEGEREAAEKMLSTAFRLGGKELQKGTLADVEIN